MSLFNPILIVAIVVVVALALYSVRFVKEWNRAVVLRLGKFAGIRGPGLILLIPFIEQVNQLVDLRLRTTRLLSETAMTRDTVSVGVETIVFWKVIDPRIAAVEVANYDDAVNQAAMVSLRETIGSATLGELLSDFAMIDERLRTSIARRVGAWGVEIVSVDIKDVAIPNALQEVMSRQAQADRERAARVTLAGAETEIAARMSEAAAIYDRSGTALKLREMGLVYEMGKSNSTILIPTEMLASVSGVAGGIAGAAALARTSQPANLPPQ